MSETTSAAAPNQTTPTTQAPNSASAPAGDAPPSILAPATPEPAAAAAPAAPLVPETYTFAAPEVDGKAVEFDQAGVDAFSPVAKQLGLTQEQYQGVLAHAVPALNAQLAAAQTTAATAGVDAFKAMVVGWGDQTKADPEIGGAKFEGTLANVSKALDTYGTPGLRQVLMDSGAGNHPEVVRFLARIGGMAADPSRLSTGGPAGRGPTTDPEKRATEFYANAGAGGVTV